MRKDKAIEAVKELPQEFDLDILLERLIFIEKIDQGLKQIEQGKTVPHEKVKEIIKSW